MLLGLGDGGDGGSDGGGDGGGGLGDGGGGLGAPCTWLLLVQLSASLARRGSKAEYEAFQVANSSAPHMSMPHHCSEAKDRGSSPLDGHRQVLIQQRALGQARLGVGGEVPLLPQRMPPLAAELGRARP